MVIELIKFPKLQEISVKG